MPGLRSEGYHTGNLLQQIVETRLLVGTAYRPQLTEMRHRLQIHGSDQARCPKGSSPSDTVTRGRILQQFKHILLRPTDLMAHGISHAAMAPDHPFVSGCLGRIQG